MKLVIPKLEDYSYEQKLQSDPKTMSYNAGWDVSYFGYHYDTGFIDFPESRWQDVYENRQKEDIHFFYIEEENKYGGVIPVHFNYGHALA